MSRAYSSGFRRSSSVVRGTTIPHGDTYVVESFNAYRERWEIWAFAASHGEAQSLLIHAADASERARVRRVK